MTPVAPTPSVPVVASEHCVNVSEDTSGVPTVGLAAEPTPVSRESVAAEPSARMSEVARCVSVCPATTGTRTRAVLPGSVTRTRTADHSAPARTTSVSTPVPCPVVREPTVQCRTTWPSVGVPREPPEIPSGTADGSPGLRSALPVGRTPTARLALTTAPSVGVKTHILETLSPGVVTSARETPSAEPHRNVTGSPTGVRTPAPGEPAGRAPTVRPSTTGPSAAVPRTSWAIPTPGATLSAPDTGTAPPTRPV